MKHTFYVLGLASVTLTFGLSGQDSARQNDSELLEIEETTLQANVDEAPAYYSDEPSSNATQLGLSIAETPQSISVITEAQMDDFALNDLNSALRYAPGVNVESVETDRHYYTARGFDITNFQIDGLGLPLVFGNIAGNLDSALYEGIEVLRGANGLATGSGNPSATINLIRKRPTNDFQASLETTYGSWNKYRGVADISSPLNESGSIRGRLVAVGQDSESYLDRYANQRFALYGIIEADLTDRTLLSMGHTYQTNRTDSPSWGALPLVYSDGTPTNYDVSTTTSADWAYWDNESHTTFIRLKQALSDTWTAKAEFSYTDFEQDSELFYMYGFPDSTTGLGLNAYPSYYESNSEEIIFNFSLEGEYEAFDRIHELTAGFNYGKIDLFQQSVYGPIGAAIPVPLENWTGNFPRPNFTPTPLNTAGGPILYREQSIYGATRLNVRDDLKLILGTRILNGSGKGNSYGTARELEYNNEWIPYFGALYDINDTYSAYFGYTKIFKPQTEVDNSLSPIDPAEGQSFEAGLKAKLFAGKAYASASVFHVEQNNLAENTGATSGGIAIYRPADFNSRGFEAELVGQVTDNFSLTASYTFLRINDENGNNTKTYTPKHLAKLAGTYSVPGTELKLGAAARWQSSTSTPIDTGSVQTTYTQESYVIIDLMASYQFNENWSASLNIFNAADKEYYSSLYWTQAYYSAPRSAEISVKYNF